jgi:hypothetical protein
MLLNHTAVKDFTRPGVRPFDHLLPAQSQIPHITAVSNLPPKTLPRPKLSPFIVLSCPTFNPT